MAAETRLAERENEVRVAQVRFSLSSIICFACHADGLEPEAVEVLAEVCLVSRVQAACQVQSDFLNLR